MVSTHVYFMDINLKLSQHETKKHAAFSGATQAWVSWQLRKMQTAVGLGKSCVQKPRLGKAWLELVICYGSVYCRNNRDRLHISNTATRTPTSAALLGKTHIGSLPKDTLKKEEATKSSLTVHFHKAHPPFIQEMKCWPTSSFHWACWGTRRVRNSAQWPDLVRGLWIFWPHSVTKFSSTVPSDDSVTWEDKRAERARGADVSQPQHCLSCLKIAWSHLKSNRCLFWSSVYKDFGCNLNLTPFLKEV